VLAPAASLPAHAPDAPVCEVTLPPPVLELTALARVDYTDAFRLTAPRGSDRTGEQWARAMLEDAPAETRRALRRGWRALGLRLGSVDDRRRVLGWPLRDSSPDHALLATDSRIGFQAELIFKREPDGLLFATILKLNNPLIRAIWAAFSPRHRNVVRGLLIQAGRRA
jgi:hypothetical protein